MFKSDSEVDTLLTHSRNILHKAIGQGNSLSPHHNAKGSHSRQTIQDKGDLAVLATLVGTKAAAELTGEDPGNVSRIRNGKTSAGGDDVAVRAATNAKLAPIQSKAIDKVDMLLGLISEERTSDLSPKDAALTAEKLVSIFDKLVPKTTLNVERANIVFFSPKAREVSDYPIIDVEPATD